MGLKKTILKKKSVIIKKYKFHTKKTNFVGFIIKLKINQYRPKEN